MNLIAYRCFDVGTAIRWTESELTMKTVESIRTESKVFSCFSILPRRRARRVVSATAHGTLNPVRQKRECFQLDETRPNGALERLRGRNGMYKSESQWERESTPGRLTHTGRSFAKRRHIYTTGPKKGAWWKRREAPKRTNTWENARQGIQREYLSLDGRRASGLARSWRAPGIVSRPVTFTRDQVKRPFISAGKHFPSLPSALTSFRLVCHHPGAHCSNCTEKKCSIIKKLLAVYML